MNSLEIGIRDYINQIVEDRDRLCESRTKALEKSFEASFIAMDRAISKAETAQREYNERSNEFRGQLDDQAKMLMPRIETQVLIGALDDKIENVRKDVANLRESRSGALGHGTGHEESWSYVIGSVALLLSLVSIIALIVSIFAK